MLSRLEIGEEEAAERRRLGLGGRGLTKLTVDGTSTRDRHFNVSGFAFTLPSGLGSAPSMLDLPSALPAHLAPSPHTLPYFDTNLLSPSLPSFALLATLVEAIDLEELSLFGSIGVVDADLLEPVELDNSYLARARSLLLTSMSYLPLVGSYLAASNAVGVEGPPVPSRSEKVDGAVGSSWGAPGSRGGGLSAGRSGSRLTEEELEWVRKEGSGRLRRVHV
ncbi:hypothetical protein BCR35DRAFT_299201 [Leucosporidium creatinivorum]|uniref:Uncharacterized protein n=1 Tax=Leucosporidium creatinivorum TaxID=106004 RepID=A0A1Y2G573_9BASI|nr:hypothetical protein BCR35DRAFT_299201 [Leucosporidium creatinivorum]